MNFSNVDVDDSFDTFLSKSTTAEDVDTSWQSQTITNSTFLQITSYKVQNVTKVKIRYLFSDGVPGIQILKNDGFLQNNSLSYEDFIIAVTDEFSAQVDVSYDVWANTSERIFSTFVPGGMFIG